MSLISERERDTAADRCNTREERQQEIDRVLEMQLHARDEFLSGQPHALLGIADTVMEEVLILAENAQRGD